MVLQSSCIASLTQITLLLQTPLSMTSASGCSLDTSLIDVYMKPLIVRPKMYTFGEWRWKGQRKLSCFQLIFKYHLIFSFSFSFLFSFQEIWIGFLKIHMWLYCWRSDLGYNVRDQFKGHNKWKWTSIPCQSCSFQLINWHLNRKSYFSTFANHGSLKTLLLRNVQCKIFLHLDILDLLVSYSKESAVFLWCWSIQLSMKTHRDR